MSDTQRGDISPTTGSNDTELTDGGEDSGPDWEGIARRRIATNLQVFHEDEVAPYNHKVTHAIENGEDPSDDYWTMVSRFGEYANRVSDELQSTGHLDSSNPRVQLHSSSYYIQDRLLQLGKAINNETVDQGLCGDSFEAARRALADAEALVDELEEEYRATPTEEQHEEQLQGIAHRHPNEDGDE